MAIANALQLEAARCHVSRSRLCLANFELLFPASDQNSDIVIRFSNLAIRRRFHAVTLTCIHLTLNPRVSYSDLKIYNLWADRTLDFTVGGFQSLRGLCSL